MLICLTASHKNAGFDMLERLSASSEHAAPRLLDGHPAVQGAVVVATCNRFEAYLDLDTPEGDSPVDAVHDAVRAVGEVAGLEADELRSTFGFVHGNAVAGHLFSVASGLESVVVGEGEIAGQVRRSLERARHEGTTTPELERLFQRASQTSRRVKNRTGIGAEGRSLVRLALDLAESRITDWSAVRVLLVGTGRYAGASLAALRDRGVNDVAVYSPTGRGPRFAASHDIEAVASGDYAMAAAGADLIVTCTMVEHHVVDRELLELGRAELAVSEGTLPVALLPGRGSTDAAGQADAATPADAATSDAPRQLVIDLGLPRNVAPDVVEVAGVELLDLETIKIHAPLEEFGATDAARELVDRAARNFGRVGDELDLAPAVVALRRHVFDVLDGEIARARSRGDDDGRTEAALRHMAGVLLHTPMVRSREYARAGEQQAWLEGLEAIFGIRPEAEAGSAASSADDAERDVL
ncbi:glutamyl-tRNA reductase [Agromyces flavus]|uniref:Glutamyl-tRNA reductase n=1 Tax=Agromyces flavus TaxID=589382 RepID=A0A1H1YL47_9MICO|nr:glutamyl-tRNA reductase [Agromyces flavus]MCP2366717.1 glutamyl-tRNA reductase [Agromyces flavus]GGI45234.1 glutamyl-tRNA reductase [Agromyces flavus]SDT21776.1 glutamyl-tRNA reductase [Agromyces flavus]